MNRAVHFLVLASVLAASVASAQEASSQAPRPARNLLDRYRSALNEYVNANWHFNPDITTDCSVVLTQIPGGTVIQVDYGICSLDAKERARFEDEASRFHLPYKGFEVVFSHKVAMRLCHPKCN
jgi:hypothetical protein